MHFDAFCWYNNLEQIDCLCRELVGDLAAYNPASWSKRATLQAKKYQNQTLHDHQWFNDPIISIRILRLAERLRGDLDLIYSSRILSCFPWSLLHSRHLVVGTLSAYFLSTSFVGARQVLFVSQDSPSSVSFLFSCSETNQWDDPAAWLEPSIDSKAAWAAERTSLSESFKAIWSCGTAATASLPAAFRASAATKRIFQLESCKASKSCGKTFLGASFATAFKASDAPYLTIHASSFKASTSCGAASAASPPRASNACTAAIRTCAIESRNASCSCGTAGAAAFPRNVKVCAAKDRTSLQSLP